MDTIKGSVFLFKDFCNSPLLFHMHKYSTNPLNPISEKDFTSAYSSLISACLLIKSNQPSTAQFLIENIVKSNKNFIPAMKVLFYIYLSQDMQKEAFDLVNSMFST